MILSAETLREGVERLAGRIDRDLAGQPVVLVGVLKGAVFFLCDLARRLTSPVSIDFVRVASYGDGVRSSGRVRVMQDLSMDIAGRNVIVVEDIVDTGATLDRILDLLRSRGPADLKVCALLRKTAPGKKIAVDYCGFEIEDRFVVGYGLDLAEGYRNLPFVAAIDEEGEEA